MTGIAETTGHQPARLVPGLLPAAPMTGTHRSTVAAVSPATFTSTAQ